VITRIWWRDVIHISHGPHIATLRTVVNRFEQIHCTREEGLPAQHTARRLTDPRVRTQLLCWHLTTRLTGPVSSICDQYVQYLLTGAKPSVLNRHRRGLTPWRCWFATYHSPTFSISCLHFLLRAPSGLEFNQVPSITKVLSLENLWPPRDLSSTRPSNVAYIYT
jgi:hypothetical protein